MMVKNIQSVLPEDKLSYYYQIAPGAKILIPVRYNQIFPVFKYIDDGINNEITTFQAELIAVKNRGGTLSEPGGWALIGTKKNCGQPNTINDFTYDLDLLDWRAAALFKNENINDFERIAAVRPYWECELAKLSDSNCIICKIPTPHIDKSDYVCDVCKTLSEI